MPGVTLFIKNKFKPKVVAYAYNSSSWEVEARRSGIQIQPQLQSELKASLDYTIPYLKKKIIIIIYFSIIGYI